MVTDGRPSVERWTFLILTLTSLGICSDTKRSDDITMAGLQALLQQQAATIQQQTATVQTLLTRMTTAEAVSHQQALTIQQQAALLQTQTAKLAADEHTIQLHAASIQTLQTQMAAVQAHENKNVAFTVTFATTALSAVNIGTHGTIKFTTIIANTGNGYNGATGIFTAPVAGTYFFFLTVQSDNHSVATYVQLTKGGATSLCLAVAEGPTHDWFDKGTCNSVVHLNVGEQVLARQYAGGTVLNEVYFTSLTGFLFHAD